MAINLRRTGEIHGVVVNYHDRIYLVTEGGHKDLATALRDSERVGVPILTRDKLPIIDSRTADDDYTIRGTGSTRDHYLIPSGIIMPGLDGRITVEHGMIKGPEVNIGEFTVTNAVNVEKLGISGVRQQGHAIIFDIVCVDERVDGANMLLVAIPDPDSIKYVKTSGDHDIDRKAIRVSGSSARMVDTGSEKIFTRIRITQSVYAPLLHNRNLFQGPSDLIGTSNLNEKKNVLHLKELSIDTIDDTPNIHSVALLARE